jgi:hypothetical protein
MNNACYQYFIFPSPFQNPDSWNENSYNFIWRLKFLRSFVVPTDKYLSTFLCLQNAITLYQSTRCNIPPDTNLQQHCYNKLAIHIDICPNTSIYFIQLHVSTYLRLSSGSQLAFKIYRRNIINNTIGRHSLKILTSFTVTLQRVRCLYKKHTCL